VSINREDYVLRNYHGTAAIPKEFVVNNANIKMSEEDDHRKNIKRIGKEFVREE